MSEKKFSEIPAEMMIREMISALKSIGGVSARLMRYLLKRLCAMMGMESGIPANYQNDLDIPSKVDDDWE